MMNTYYLIAAAGVAFCIIFLVVFFVLGGQSAESGRLAEVAGAEIPSSRLLGKVGHDGRVSADRIALALGPVFRLVGTREDSDLSRRLVSAGYRKVSHVQIFTSVKILLPIIAGVGVGLAMKSFFYMVIAAAVGFLAPDLWLSTMISRRAHRIRLSLPDALDLLVICMEAGLGLDQAIVRVGSELKISHPELSDEFLIVNLEQRAGKPRLEAWRHMADRVAVENVRSFVQMLVQTERFGTPISKSLGVFADNLRVRRRQQAEEMAAKTTIKLIPPLVLFIFPSLFIVLLAPAMLTIAHNMAAAFANQ
jgi:tight adherence protein C